MAPRTISRFVLGALLAPCLAFRSPRKHSLPGSGLGDITRAENMEKDMPGPAMDRAAASNAILVMESERLDSLARYMQERADVLQAHLGHKGNPHVEVFTKDAKEWAGKVFADSERGLATASLVSSAIASFSAFKEGGDHAVGRARNEAVLELNALVTKADVEYADLLKTQTLISPRVEPNTRSMYWKVMNYVDKGMMDAPATCAGVTAGKPIVGKSWSECAAVCADLMGDCAGFTFFPSKMCFLHKEIKSVSYYTGCDTDQESDNPIVTSPLRIMCSVKSPEFDGRGLTTNTVDSCPVYEDEGMKFNVADGLPTSVKSAAFTAGTLIIDTPGVYHLEEDIVFNPKTPLSSGISNRDVSFPDPTSERYPQLGGYYLGFFAAIAVQADNVTIDCKGHSISQAPYFHKRQRFFANIELGSRPFISGDGPPQFANDFLTHPGLVSPKNVRIENCKLGLSSHHGIHGNNPRGVFLKNLEITDFEVGGIGLNGAHDVYIEDVDIHTSLKETFSAHLSHAIFLDHLMNTLIPTQPALSVEANKAKVTIRGEEHTVGDIFANLHEDLNTYYESNRGPLRRLVGNGHLAPDGSAIYGIVIHKVGIVVNDFGACPLSGKASAHTKAEDNTVYNINIRDVEIEDLLVDVFQMTRLVIDGVQVMGPAGDVFDWKANVGRRGQYIGTTLSDAQLAVGAFKKHLSGLPDIEQKSLAYYFGGTHIPDSVLEWAARRGAEWPRDVGAFKCDGDAMSHVNKGAVGLFLNYVDEGSSFRDIDIKNISNRGGVDAPAHLCVQPNYQGSDSYGAAIVNSPGVMLDTDISIKSVTAGQGGTAHDVDVKTTYCSTCA